MPVTIKTSTSFILVVFSLLVASSFAQPQSQIDALTDLYYYTNGPYWYSRDNWISGLPCEKSWFGVTCDENDNIIKINLPGNRVIGNIPESFGQLPFLQDLNLNYNSFYGNFPQSFSNLTGLTNLSFSSSTLTGTFPAILFSLPSLQIIDLSSNSLSDQVPDKFDKLTNINSLNLSGNQFSGSVPPTILNNLKNCEISFAENQLSSIPWDKWTNPNTLSNSSLSLYNNHITGNLSYQIYWARSIILSFNIFTGPLPELNTTNGVPLITSISLASNQLENNLPISLTQATFLNNFAVDYNHEMSGEIPVEFASMPNLQSLTFYGTSLTCPDDKQWDAFMTHSHVSCPFDYSSQNHHEFISWYIAVYIAFVVLIVASALLLLFCAIRPRQNNKSISV